MWILTIRLMGGLMTDNTDNNVLMKCVNCGYEELVPLSDLELLRDLPPISNEDHLLCPFCLHDMYRKDSPRFKKLR